MAGSLPPDPWIWLNGQKCSVTRHSPDGPTQHVAWTSKTVTDAEGMFHKHADIRPGDLVSIPRQSGGPVERVVDTVATSLDGKRQRVTWRLPNGAPTALALWELHPVVHQAAGQLYIDGHYAQAIGEATKALDVEVRRCSGLQLTGRELMNKAFSEQGPLDVRQHEGTTGDDEQTGFRFLFVGAVTALRNPRAHEFIDDDPASALEHLALVSLLLRRLDSAESRTTSEPRSRQDLRDPGE